MDPEVFDTLSDPDRDSLFAGQEDFMKEATASGEMWARGICRGGGDVVTEQGTPRVVAVGRGAEESAGPAPGSGAHHRRLDVWVGRWINEGQTVPAVDGPSVKIVTSDVYEWAPGGFFILHTAYGRIGDTGVGGTEIIGFDEATGRYRAHFFDSFGNVTVHDLTVEGEVWKYQGDTTRSTVTFGDGGRIQTVLHERPDDGQKYVPSMRITLTKVE
jgi:hypothetical protein